MSVTAATREKRHHPETAEPVGFRVLAWGLFFSVVVLLVAGVASMPAGLTASPAELIGWVVLVSASSLVPLTSGRMPALVIDMPILLGAGFVFGPTFAGLVGLLGCVDIREIRREVSINRAIINRSQIAISVMAAAATFRLLQGHLGIWPWAAVAGLIAVLVDSVVNYTLVALGTSLLDGRRMVSVFREMRLGSMWMFASVYLCFGFLGLLLAEMYVRVGFAGVVGFVAPVVLGRQAFVHWRHLDDARSSLQTKNEALRSVDQRIADERSDERARIAAALHDDVLQCLYNVTIHTHIIREDLRAGRLLDLDDDVPALLSASEQAVEELRDVIRDLRRSTIGHAGLVDTLTLLVDHLASESGVHFVSDLDCTLHAEPSLELLIYQVAREALTNTMKHSGARTIWVSLSYDSGAIELSVEDDGSGFDPSGFRDSRHFGVDLMRERAGLANGTLELRSQPGMGTSVVLRVPN
ncbi:MAG: sensor histidine kinase [Solirubrobacterales bacterium]